MGRRKTAGATERAVQECVAQVAEAALACAQEANGDLAHVTQAELVDALEEQLESGELAGVADEELVSKVEALARHAQGAQHDFFAWAFAPAADGSPFSFPPRVRRLLILVALGQTLALESDGAVAGADALLCLLELPGALSFQMFAPGLVRAVLTRFDLCCAVAPRLAVVAKNLGFRTRLQAEDLLEIFLKGLIGCGPHLDASGRETVVAALRHYAFDSHMQANGSESPTSEDDSRAANAEKLMSSDAQSEAEDATPDAVRTKILRCLLLALTVEDQSQSGTPWVVSILQGLIAQEHELREPNGAAERPEAAAAIDVEQAPVSEVALKMLEHLTFKTPESAAAQRRVAEVIVCILQALETDVALGTLFNFLKFLSKLSQSRTQNHRAYAALVAGAIMGRCENLTEDMAQGLVELLCARSTDKSHTVRVSASQGLGFVIDAPFLSDERIASLEPELARMLILSPAKALRLRIADPKPAVRNAAVKALQGFFSSPLPAQMRGGSELMHRCLVALCDRSRDERPLIRAAVLKTAAGLAEHCNEERVLKLWASAVLPLVFDTEQSVHKKAWEAVKAAIFSALPQSVARDGTLKDVQPWRLMAMFGDEDLVCVRHAFLCLSRKSDKGEAGMKAKPIIRAAQAAIEACGMSDGEACAGADREIVLVGAWTLLDLIAGGSNEVKQSAAEDVKIKMEAIKSLDVAGVARAWARHFEDEEGLRGTPVRVHHGILNVLMGVSDKIPADTATSMAASLYSLVAEMALDPLLLRKCLLLLVALCKAKAGSEKDAVAMVRKWGDSLKEQSEKVLGQLHAAATDGTEPPERDEVTHALFLAGELAVLGLDPDDKTKALIPLSDRLVTLTMGILAREDPEDDSEVHIPADDEIRAHAFVATGKICLRDDRTAKRATTMLVRELDQCGRSEVIRSNVMVILGDLCRRYTNIIDPHMDTICACLSDPSATVRRHALILLTGLLQEDYIKWRGALFVRYLMCAVDPDEDVRSLVGYALREVFPDKNPGLYHGQFVEVLHALNGVSTAKYQVARQIGLSAERPAEGSLAAQRLAYVERVTQGTSEAGDLRARLYSLLLDNMNSPHKLEVTNKICRDVLGEVLDGKLALPRARAEGGAREAMDKLLCDCFAVLCSPSLKVKVASGAAAAAAEEDQEIAAAQSATLQMKMAEAKSKVVSKLERKNLTDNVIPLTISFYRMLQRERSPHLRDVSLYLQALMKNFAEEMDQVLGADRQLEQEIKYDIAQEKKRAEREAEGAENKAARRNKRRSLAPETPEHGGVSANGTARKSRVAKKARRASGVTFQPTARDTAARSKAGVLRTPIPNSAKKRRTSLVATELRRLQANPAPKLTHSERAKSTSRKPLRAVTLEGGRATLRKSQRKWSVEPSSSSRLRINFDEVEDDGKAISKNLDAQLQALGA